MIQSPPSPTVTTWQEFAAVVRTRGCRLLYRLDEFPGAVLVAGCQRSGTTMLARILTTSEGMVNYWFGRDDELDAALILSGEVAHEPDGRYCFQTTYLNQCVDEYFQHGDAFQIIWVLRDPLSVVYSMLYNWKRYALDELFEACGAPLLSTAERLQTRLFGLDRVEPLKRACLAYNSKVSQLFTLQSAFGPDRLMVLDYDRLVDHKNGVLPGVYRFIDLSYQPAYADQIHGRSQNKKSGLTEQETAVIEKLCRPIYRRASRLCTEFA